jgi:Tfp pilus assembly protein PilF
MKKSHPLPCSAAVMATLLGAAALLSACSSGYQKLETADEPSAKPATTAKAVTSAAATAAPEKAVVKTPSASETALAEGIKAYQAGQYRQSETQLKAALKSGLQSPTDMANAHKHLAFIYCTSKRTGLCAAAFKNAKAADPGFALTKSEAGHPQWGKTYKSALGLK